MNGPDSASASSVSPPDADRRTVSGHRTAGVLSVAEVGLGMLACAATALLYTSYFSSLHYLLPLLIAAGGGAALATLATCRRWRATVVLLAAVVGFEVLAVFGVFTATLSSGVPTMTSIIELGAGLVWGWARMLTVNLPAEATGELLVTPTAITWAAAFLTTTLTLRTRTALLPLLPPLMALLVGLLLTASRTGADMPTTAMFLITVLALMLVRSIRLDSHDRVDIEDLDIAQPYRAQVQDSAPMRRARLVASRAAFSVPVVLVVALLGITGSKLIPVSSGEERFDLRTVIPQPVTLQDSLTPLSTLKSQLRDPDRELFTVRIDDNQTGAGVDRVRTAVLDDFDGALWTSDDRFLVAGRTLSSDLSTADARQVALHVSITQLPGPYLPCLGWPVRVDRPGFGFSSTSGTLVTNEPLPGLNYDVVGELRPRDDAALRDSAPSREEGLDRYTRLAPGFPPDLRAMGTNLTAATNNPYSRLVAIEKYLQALPYSLDAPPGHSYHALRRLFSADPGNRRIGYAEQHAAAFAVLARSQGFPTRVAVGYLLNPDRRRVNTYTVTGADAHAWAEVNLSGHGWVAFNPTDPDRTPVAADVEPPEAQAAGPSPAIENPGSPPPGKSPLPVGGTKISLSVTPWLLVAGLVVLLALLPAVITGEKIRRRLRRHRGRSAAQVLGAWRETTDRLIERGVEVPRSLTAHEVAHRAEQHLGAPAAAVAALAPIVTEAIFCPTPPDGDTVREAWNLDAQLRRALRHVDGPLGLIRAWLDPRPLTADWRDRRQRRRTLERLKGG